MRFITLFIALSLTAVTLQAQEFKVVVTTDFKGAVTQGSIDQLITYIQEGKPVRLGWQLDFNKDGVSDLEHWVDTEFITINNGHVYSQIKTIHQQSPLPDNVELSGGENLWYALINTKGIMQHKYIFENPPQIRDANGKVLTDNASKEMVASFLQLQEEKVATSWAVSF